MESQILELITSRLERIEKQNDAQLELLNKHLDKYSETKQTVSRHSTYFKILGFGIPPFVGYLATKLGLK